MNSSSPRPSPSWALPVLVLAAGLLYALRLGAAPVERAEIYFVDAARGMVESGDWLTPRYRGEPFFDKPALTYWLIALAFEAGGFTLAAARTVPVLAALGALAATAWLGRLLFDAATGLRAAAVMASTLLVMSFSRVAMSDMLLACFTTLAVAAAVRLARQPGAAGAALLGALLGLGFLTKGPVALLFPGLAVLLLLHARGFRPGLGAGAWAAAIAAFAVPGLGWFAAVGARLGSGPLAYFFLRENVERFAGATYDADRSPFYYLGAYLAVGLPWSLVFPLAAWRLPRGQRMLLAWIALMLVPLSLSRGKIDYYLLPLVPPASIVVGCWLGSEWRRLDRGWARAALLACAAAVAALPWAVGRFPDPWLPGRAAQVVLALTCAACVVGLVAAAARTRAATVLAAFGGAAAALFALLAWSFVPAFRDRQPNAEIVADVQRELRYRPEASLALCEDPVRAQRDILFFARLPVVERCDLWAPASSRLPFLLLLAPEQRIALGGVPGLREVARYEGLPATALTLEGMLGGVGPQPVYLMANFATDDPVARLKQRRERRRAIYEAWLRDEID